MEEKKDRLILGIDEAGRGPVIGSLVIVGYMIKESDLPKLKELGVKDSKLLTHPKRLKLRDRLIDLAEDMKIVVVSPKEIDEAVESENHNQNWLEAEKAAKIMDDLYPDDQRAYSWFLYSLGHRTLCSK